MLPVKQIYLPTEGLRKYADNRGPSFQKKGLLIPSMHRADNYYQKYELEAFLPSSSSFSSCVCVIASKMTSLEVLLCYFKIIDNVKSLTKLGDFANFKIIHKLDYKPYHTLDNFAGKNALLPN